jgi:hypothetical protein
MAGKTATAIPTGITETFTSRTTAAKPGRNTASIGQTTRNIGTITVRSPSTPCREVRRTKFTAAMLLSIYTRSGDQNPLHGMLAKTFGNDSEHTTGDVNIAPGTNAAATTDTSFRRIGSVRILVAGTGFGSTKFQS